MDQTATSSITDITIIQSGLDEETLSIVLQWPKALKRLHFEHAGASVGGDSISPSRFAHDLASQKRSLGILQILDHTGSWFWDSLILSEEDNPIPFNVSFLWEFTSLRILDIEFELLLGEKCDFFAKHGSIVQGGRSTHRFVGLVARISGKVDTTCAGKL